MVKDIFYVYFLLPELKNTSFDIFYFATKYVLQVR